MLLPNSYSGLSKISKNRVERKEIDHDPFSSLKSFIEGEEKERQRLSRELHDGIGQYLISIKMKLESLLYLDEDEVKEQISRLRTDFDEVLDEIRRISNNLMPSVLEAFGVVFAIRNLCIETSEHTGLKISLDFKGDLESLNTTLKTYLFRIAQEAVNNIVKHARATSVGIILERKKDEVVFNIRDDGKGFNLQEIKAGTGHGMNNMRERVNLLKGAIKIESHENIGTEIAIDIPVFH
ncbi:MAG: sensor histidine kinase [Bacteroidales bacterium]|nr:sensor histidine kinase [Bacteroidota bacterium]MBL6949616.1 sensor histidine kinase [Bacteroidales bacterium]